MRIAYDERYNIGFYGLERRWHPFDTHKYARAWSKLETQLGRRLRTLHLPVPREINLAELLEVHTPGYLDEVSEPARLAKIVEVSALAWFPRFLLDRYVLAPMRRQTMGTLLAARAALETGLAVNLGGGFHHAKPRRGEGFCVYNDIAVAAAQLRSEAALGVDQRLVYIDLDVHQGNGVAHCFQDDRRAFLFDMFNPDIYPFGDSAAARIDCPLALPPRCTGAEYLRLLRQSLPGFLDSVARSSSVGLAVYNAGTDVYVDDALGGVSCSAAEVLERDLYVVEQLRSRDLPTMMLTSGGYSEASHALIAATVAALSEQYA